MTAIQTELCECVRLLQLCACVCKSRHSASCRVFGSLLWFLCSGMCEDLAGRAPRHLLNIRGNNSWADLKHGHPLHLVVSLRITSAASHSRWQVSVHQPAEFRARQWAKHHILQIIHEKTSPPSLSDFLLLCLGTKWVVYSDFTALISHHVWFPIMCQLVVEINFGSTVVIHQLLSCGFERLRRTKKEVDYIGRWWGQASVNYQEIFFLNLTYSCFTNVTYFYIYIK